MLSDCVCWEGWGEEGVIYYFKSQLVSVVTIIQPAQRLSQPGKTLCNANLINASLGSQDPDESLSVSPGHMLEGCKRLFYGIILMMLLHHHHPAAAMNMAQKQCWGVQVVCIALHWCAFDDQGTENQYCLRTPEMTCQHLKEAHIWLHCTNPLSQPAPIPSTPPQSDIEHQRLSVMDGTIMINNSVPSYLKPLCLHELLNWWFLFFIWLAMHMFKYLDHSKNWPAICLNIWIIIKSQFVSYTIIWVLTFYFNGEALWYWKLL